MAEKNIEKVQEEFDLEKNVTIKSIANWETTFQRSTTIGDVVVAPNGSMRLTRNEIIAQVQTANKLFSGNDGQGSHATYYIDDVATRRHLGFESDDGINKQKVFTDDLVKEVFNIKSQASFEEKCKDAFQTRAEKYSLIQAIKRLKINDYTKIRFAEEYTGHKVM